MMGTILYLIGLACAIWCVYELFTTKQIDIIWKVVISVVLLSTSWIGLAVYYFLLRNRIN
ncbi:MAG: hypothetical protein J6R87_02770 [Rikenellaceae bacterium]|nr:hypothetical protein [Rikenellaceae bacterium]